MRKITVATLNQEILDILENSGPLKTTENYNKPDAIKNDFYISWGWGWAISASIIINLNPEYARNICHPSVTVSWTTSRYSPGRARTAASLHSEVANLALRLEGLLNETTVVIEEEK